MTYQLYVFMAEEEATPDDDHSSAYFNYELFQERLRAEHFCSHCYAERKCLMELSACKLSYLASHYHHTSKLPDVDTATLG